MIDFSNNINQFGPPPGYKKFFHSEKLVKYPDYQQNMPRQCFSEKYGIFPEHVSLSVGATEAISITARLSFGFAAGICPSFWEYEHFYTKYHGKESYKKLYLSVEKGFSFPNDAFKRLIDEHSIKTFYLANPNNPTTTVFDKKMLLELVHYYKDIFFVIDETYLLFSHQYDEQSLIKEAVNLPNLAVITSMSKIYSLPDLRLGVCVSNALYMEKFRSLLIPYGVSNMSQLYLSWLIQQDAYLTETRDQYATLSRNLKEQLHKRLGKNVEVYTSSAPYALIKIKGVRENLRDYLKDQNQLVRGGEEFETLDGSWIRVSLKDYSSNEKLINNIHNFLLKNGVPG